MSLDRVVFPTKPANPVGKMLEAIGSFERRHPMAALAIAWAVLGVVLAISAVVKP